MAKKQTMKWPKDRQRNGQKIDNEMAKRQTMKWPKEGQTMIYKTLHSKSNSDRTNPTQIKE